MIMRLLFGKYIQREINREMDDFYRRRELENMQKEISLLHKAVVEIKKKLKKEDEELEKAMKEAEAIMAANVVEFMEDEE